MKDNKHKSGVMTTPLIRDTPIGMSTPHPSPGGGKSLWWMDHQLKSVKWSKGYSEFITISKK